MINWDNLEFYPNENIWVAKSSNGQEVYIPNGLNKPHQEWLNFAKKALNDQSIVSRAKDLLNYWIKEDKGGTWALDHVNFSGEFTEIHRNWEMAFTLDNDDYGLWIVTFCEFGPSSFRRDNS